MSWRSQQEVYIVMWKSTKSGATLSDIRKSEEGLNRLLRTLKYMGISENDIIVSTQEKVWMPETKKPDGRKVKGYKRETKKNNNVVPLKLVQ